MKKGGFILYPDQYEVIQDWTDEQIGMLTRSIYLYVRTGKTNSIQDPSVLVMFSVIKNQIDRDTEKYETRCRKNKESIQKRWEGK